MSEPTSASRRRALEAWRRVEDEAAHLEVALRAARERARVARWRADDRRVRGEQARLAGQEIFAAGLLDAAAAHERAARLAEEEAARLDALRRAAERESEARRVRLAAADGAAPLARPEVA